MWASVALANLPWHFDASHNRPRGDARQSLTRLCAKCGAIAATPAMSSDALRPSSPPSRDQILLRLGAEETCGERHICYFCAAFRARQLTGQNAAKLPAALHGIRSREDALLCEQVSSLEKKALTNGEKCRCAPVWHAHGVLPLLVKIFEVVDPARRLRHSSCKPALTFAPQAASRGEPHALQIIHGKTWHVQPVTDAEKAEDNQENQEQT